MGELEVLKTKVIDSIAFASLAVRRFMAEEDIPRESKRFVNALFGTYADEVTRWMRDGIETDEDISVTIRNKMDSRLDEALEKMRGNGKRRKVMASRSK